MVETLLCFNDFHIKLHTFYLPKKRRSFRSEYVKIPNINNVISPFFYFVRHLFCFSLQQGSVRHQYQRNWNLWGSWVFVLCHVGTVGFTPIMSSAEIRLLLNVLKLTLALIPTDYEEDGTEVNVTFEMLLKCLPAVRMQRTSKLHLCCLGSWRAQLLHGCHPTENKEKEWEQLC